MPDENGEQNVILVLPQASWEVLHESLELDCRSRAADPELRQQVREALDSVTQVDSVLHVGLAISRGHIDFVHADVRPRGCESALADWLREQVGLPDDITMDDWQALRDAGAVPDGIDVVVRGVPVHITRRREDAA